MEDGAVYGGWCSLWGMVQFTTPYLFNPPSLCKTTKIQCFPMQHTRIPLQPKQFLWNLTLRRKFATALTKLFFLTSDQAQLCPGTLAGCRLKPDTPRDGHHYFGAKVKNAWSPSPQVFIIWCLDYIQNLYIQTYF
jgi:hypothetical protein